MAGERCARVSNFFYEDSKSKIFFFFFGGGGGYVGEGEGGWSKCIFLL